MKKPSTNPFLDNISGVTEITNGNGHHHDKMVRSSSFDEQHVLEELRHYLPTQTPLKDFIHHNTLHAFQKSKFYDAIFQASKIFGYQVTLQLSEYRQLYAIGRIREDILEHVIINRKGIDQVSDWKGKMLEKNYDCSNPTRIGQLRNEWKHRYHIDLDNLVQPLLFRILCSYLDQGISLWKFPLHPDGFLASLRSLEQNSYSSFFKTKKVRSIFLEGNTRIRSLLSVIVGNEIFFEQYLFDQQFSHQGWSGMVATLEQQPNAILDARKISLHDLIVFELLLELDALEYNLGDQWEPLSGHVPFDYPALFAPVPKTEITEIFTLWQDAFEWSYYDEVLAGLALNRNQKQEPPVKKSFQAMFCIDERECSIRRHIESVAPDCETLGTPGFFSVEFFFQPENGSFYDKLCPQPVTPKYLIKEFNVKEKRKHELLYTKQAHTLIPGFLITLSLGIWSAVKIFLNLFRPKKSPASSNAFAHMIEDSELTIENKHPDDKENGLQIGFTVEEMATRVENLLRGIALVNNFAPLIYVIAHGSSSANNPHHGAHDCGACSGRPGSINARVFAFMANHPGVRNILRGKGIDIPENTQFVGGLHDTAADQIRFFDLLKLSEQNSKSCSEHIRLFEKALDLNAKERSRRFASIPTKSGIRNVREEIRKRSVSLFEPRPELGHGTNSLCIVGHRSMTKGLFLDRRAFMNSYDYKNDPEGKLLQGIMRPLGPVCGGINLEYYFSRVDNYKLGAGTKLPHNVMGLIGVANSSDGDLRPGLPVQMIEVHDPVRLLIIVQHFPDVVLKTIQSAPEMYEWFINEWVHLVAVHPVSGQFHYFKNGGFTIYEPLKKQLDRVTDIHKLIESAPEMETNETVDATKENLPVYLLN